VKEDPAVPEGEVNFLDRPDKEGVCIGKIINIGEDKEV